MLCAGSKGAEHRSGPSSRPIRLWSTTMSFRLRRQQKCHWSQGQWIPTAHNPHFVLRHHSRPADSRGQRGRPLSTTKASDILGVNQPIFLAWDEAGNSLAQCPALLHECDPDPIGALADVGEWSALCIEPITLKTAVARARSAQGPGGKAASHNSTAKPSPRRDAGVRGADESAL